MLTAPALLIIRGVLLVYAFLLRIHDTVWSPSALPASDPPLQAHRKTDRSGSLAFDGFPTSAYCCRSMCCSTLELAYQFLRRQRFEKSAFASPRTCSSIYFRFHQLSIASVTSHLVLNGMCYPSEIRDLRESSHDIISGCSFLMKNEIVIALTIPRMGLSYLTHRRIKAVFFN